MTLGCLLIGTLINFNNRIIQRYKSLESSCYIIYNIKIIELTCIRDATNFEHTSLGAHHCHCSGD